MDGPFSRITAALATAMLVWSPALPGCVAFKDKADVPVRADLAHYQAAATQIEFPNVATLSHEAETALPPITLECDALPEHWDLTLEEVVQIALSNSRVLRDLGALVFRAPAGVPTAFDPALVETDPQFGVEAALSAFDASFAKSAFWEKNDRALNNVFFGGGTRIFQQDVGVVQSQLSKRAATGSEFIFRHITEYDANNAPGNQFFSAWTVMLEAEARQPLLQGAGVEFNRIAGPFAVPGLYSGVVIARVNTDIQLAEFEAGVRNFLSDLENAYWDLYFAYRDLDAKIRARDTALETWRSIHALYVAGRVGGEAEKEAQAREQYFRFEEEVQNALNGRRTEGTRSFNGASGGTFRGTGGVHVSERRLRWLMGIPITDGKLIRPADEPSRARVLFDWHHVLIESLARRVELRQQKWRIKRRELELVAAKNFLLPQLDGVGRYRWRGFGDDLLDPHRAGRDRFDNAWMDLTRGDFQEWQLGLELTMPLGFRRGHAAVRHAELQLARERALLHEQERALVQEMSDAIAEMDRAYAVLQTNYNRNTAAREQLASVQAAYEADTAPLMLLLDSQRRQAESEIAYYRSLVEYALAVKNVHFEKGSLLDYNEVWLSEGPWPKKAHHDAAERMARRGHPLDETGVFNPPVVVSGGVYPQNLVPEPKLHEPPHLAPPPFPLPLPPEPDEPPFMDRLD